MSRLSCLAAFFLLVGLLFDPRRAEAETPPAAVEVLPGATEIDATALREAVARELGTPVVSGAAIAFIVSIDRDRGELVVERREATGGVSRRVPLPPDHEQLLREAVFLIGNLARDEAVDVVRELRPQADAPAPKGPTDDPRDRKADAKASFAPPRLESPPQRPSSPDARPRVWLGLAVSLDLVAIRGDESACADSNYRCIDSNDNPVVGTGSVSGGVAVGTAHWLITADYAGTGNFLFGVRAGYISGTYPGPDITGPPIHLETRVTYVFGRDPLWTAGVAPYVMLAGGIAETAGNVGVVVAGPESSWNGGVVQLGTGSGPVSAKAWEVDAGFFASVGAGVRLPVTPNTQVLLGARFNATLDPFRPAVLSVSPDLAWAYGF